MILNALGVEHLSQLTDEEDEPAPAPQPTAPSALTLTDADGNPLISDENMPQAVTAAPTTPKKPIDRSKPPRSRSYPRPAPRRSQLSSANQPKDTGFKAQTAPVEAPQEAKPDMQELLAKEEGKPSLQELGRGGIANQVPHHVAAAHSRRPQPKIGTLPSKKSSTKPKLAPLPEEEKKKYGHHTFDDFMGRIDAHPELPAATDHTLEPGYEHEDIEVKRLETEQAPEQPAQEEGPENINALLDEQKDEAQAGPAGPDMDDLLNEEDIEELHKTPDPTETPKAVDLNNIPETPQVAQIGKAATEIHNSIALKIIVILVGVLALVGLTASILTQISG